VAVVIPSDWEILPIGSVGELSTGTTPPTQDRSLYGDEYPFISPADLGSEKYIRNAEKNLSAKGYLGTRQIPKGSLLFVCIGSTIGKTGIATTSSSCNQQINYLVPSEKYHSEYLYYALSAIAPLVKEQAGEQAVPMVNKSEFAKFTIPVPKLNEQIAIAKALSDIDELIETLKSEIIKNQNLHTSVIQKLFPTNFLKNKLPNGWELRSLGELGTISGAGVDKVSRSSDVPIKLLNYMDVHRNTFVTPAIDFMDTTATKDQIRNCSLIKGDILFTPTSETPEDIARSSVVLSDFMDTCYSYHLIRFRPKIKLDLNYLAFVFLLEDFRLQAQKAAEGSGTRYVITLPRFRSLLIPIPDIKIQNEIGQVVNDINNQIESLKNELGKYQQLKNGMAQDLLTGKVRLV
jgi:type I restriction enzyme, S subunit